MGTSIKSPYVHGYGFLWSVQNAMGLLGVSRPTLYRWMESGKLDFVETQGRRYVSQAEIDRVNAERSKEEGVSDE